MPPCAGVWLLVVDGHGGPFYEQPGRIQLHEPIGEHVLDRLERADGPTELVPLLGVFDSTVQGCAPG
jgi:hypothetical protein